MSRVEKKGNHVIITLMAFDRRHCQSIKGIESVWSGEAGFVCMSGLPDRKANEKMGKIKGDSGVFAEETPPLTSLSFVLNSNLFWEAGAFPTFRLSACEWRLWLCRSHLQPAVEDVFLLGACRCFAVGAAVKKKKNCKIVKHYFGRDWCACGWRHWHGGQISWPQDPVEPT